VALDESTPEPSLSLVRQYRPAHDRWFWEIPAGTRDVEGESALACARRELVEEAGLEAGSWEELMSIAPATGSSNTVVDIFLARDLRAVEARPEGEEESVMQRELVPLGSVWSLVTSEPPVNATTALGIRLATARLPDIARWLG
jgi:8-oxo-dGTP pyrophosphatase MutT (NUDIX family)